MDTAMVDQVRSFNRTVMQRIGALNDTFLGRRRPLGQARLLWEIGPDGSELRALRSRLDLDSGYVSRLLRSLEADGLVIVAPTDADRRTRTARLCIAAYFAELDRRSDTGFDPGAGISAEPHELRPPAGAMLVAYLRSEPVGCGAVKHHPGAASEIKRMWVAEHARGLGIAKRMLAELEAQAIASGARAARLETNRALTEAIALYRSAGYVEVPAFNDEPFAHHWFEKAFTRSA